MPHSHRRPAHSPWAHLTSSLLAAGTLVGTVHAGDSVRRYGQPTPGSGNIAPTIWVNTTPRPGDANFKLRVERSLGGTWAFPFAATRPADSIHGGVRFLVDTSVAAYGGAYFLPGRGDGGGSGDIPIPLANNRELIGQPIYVQAFTLDDFAPNPLGFAATTGLRVVPAMPAQLVVARALNGSPDPQTAIDLAANAVVDYDRTLFDDASGVTFAQRGAVALQLDPATARLRAFDTSSFPPTWRSNGALSTEGHPEFIVLTPDGSRAYVAYSATLGASPPITAHHAAAGATFGQAWPGPAIRLERIADPRAMAFSPDSATAFVAALGPLSGASGSLTRVDVRVQSPTFHQATGSIDFAGMLATGVAIAAHGSLLYVPLVNANGQAEVAVIDVAAFAPRDMDAGAPGVQNLGGEVSRPRTPLPSVLGQVVADPRGDEIYCATVGGVVRVTVGADSTNFGRVTLLSGSIAPNQLVTQVVLTDGADRLYAATAGQVVEFDTRQLSAVRTWPISGTTALALR